MTGEQPTYRDLWLRIREDLPKKGRKGRDARRASRSSRPSCEGRASLASTATTSSRFAGGKPTRTRRHGADAARVHRRLQQHQRLQARVRLRRRVDEDARRRHRRSLVPGRLPLVQQRRRRSLVGTAQHHPRRLRAARVRRGDERRVQEDRRDRDRGVQGRVPRALSRPRRRGPDRRGPAARGDEHRRQAGQARRAHPLRRVGLDADRGLGRQHRHAHPRRPGVRHAAPVRAGRRPRPAAHELRRRTRMAASRRSTPRSTACRSRSSRLRARPPSRHRAPRRRACAPSRNAPLCEITFPRLAGLPLRAADRASQCAVHRGVDVRALDRRRPDQDRERADRRRDGASTRSTICAPGGQTKSPSCSRSSCSRSTSAGRRAAAGHEGAARVRRRGASLALPAGAGDREAMDGRVPHAARTSRTRFRSSCCCSSSPTTRPTGSTTSIVVGVRRRAHARSRSCVPYDTVGTTRWVDFDTIKTVWPTRRRQVPRLTRRADTGCGSRSWRRCSRRWTR